MLWRSQTERAEALLSYVGALVRVDAGIADDEMKFLQRLAARIAIPSQEVPSTLARILGMTAPIYPIESMDGKLEFLDVLTDAAYADGKLSPNEEKVLRTVAGSIGLSESELQSRMEEGYRRYLRCTPTIPCRPAVRSRSLLTRVFRKDDQPVLLFTDVKDSTVLFEGFGDKEATRLLCELEEMQAACLHERHGHLVKKIGDSIFATFKDANEAVRCAIKIQEQVRRWRMIRSFEMLIGVRIVLHRGPAEVDDHDIHGSSVNVAAHLKPLCDADEVVVSDAVHAKLEPQIGSGFHHFGPCLPKGFQRIVEVFRWRAPWLTPRISSTFRIKQRTPIREFYWQEDRKGDKYQLVGRSPENRAQCVALSGELKTVGRGETCNVRIDSHKISAKHAGFVVVRGQCWVFDVGGKSEVFLSYPGRKEEWIVADRAPVTVGSTLKTGYLAWRICESGK